MEINANFLEPLSNVANKLIDKISDVCGYFSDPRGLKRIQTESIKIHAEQVMQDDALSRVEKEDFIARIPYLHKQNKNRDKIIEIACENLTEEATPDAIDNDWIMDYLDKIKNISSSQGQLMWGKLLASEANTVGSISKRLVNNIYLMDQRDAWQFSMFTSFCFYDAYTDSIAHPLIYIRKMQRLYQQTFLTTQFISNLQNWGLIECNYDPGFVFITKKDLVYMGSQYSLHADKLGGTIDAGNIRFTKDGQALFNIIDKENSIVNLEKTLEAFSSLGIHYEASSRRGVWQSDKFREVYPRPTI